eukprot:Tbor_TRINITY_DN5751_c3_g1::TRINITY_DN5751_c3_g1_i9::g.20806::m.20806
MAQRPFVIFELYPFFSEGKEMRTTISYNGRSFWWNSKYMSVTCFIVATDLIEEKDQKTLFGKTYIKSGHFVAVIPRGPRLFIVNDDEPVRTCPRKVRDALLGGTTHIFACEVLPQNRKNKKRNSGNLTARDLKSRKTTSLEEKMEIFMTRVEQKIVSLDKKVADNLEKKVTEPNTKSQTQSPSILTQLQSQRKGKGSPDEENTVEKTKEASLKVIQRNVRRSMTYTKKQELLLHNADVYLLQEVKQNMVPPQNYYQIVNKRAAIWYKKSVTFDDLKQFKFL